MKNITKNNTVYKSYLLRLHREADSNRLLIRLQAVELDAAVLSFASLESFVAYLENVLVERTERFSTMVTLFVNHAVQDFNKWKEVYDALGTTRQQMGVIGASVHRITIGTNRLTITHQFKNLKSAMAFANSDELKQAMAEAGVVGPPDMWFAEEIERTEF
jgi:hypothetical protein